MTLRNAIILLAVAVGSGCGGDTPSNPVKEAFASAARTGEAGTPVVFRFSTNGGARLFRLPKLDEVSWQFDAGGEPFVRIVGFSGDDDRIYALAADDSTGMHLVTFDLATGRTHIVDSNVTVAALGPTGQAYVLHRDGTLGEVEHRRIQVWSDTLADTTAVIHGVVRDRVLAITNVEGSRRLSLHAKGQPPISQPLPDGEVAVAPWGDLVAVAAPSDVLLLDPTDSTAVRSVPLRPAPRLIALSPSAHRIYVVAGDNRLVAIDRFSRNVVGSWEAPGRIAALRVGPRGQTMLVRPESGDSIWVVDLPTLQARGVVEARWADDLPSVAFDGSILARQGTGVRALDAESLQATATASTRPGDLWLAIEWDPRRPALEFARDTSSTTETVARIIYIQVSSSRNPAWAEAFAAEFRGAGLNATVLTPDSTEELYRVVLGPFPTRSEAEELGRTLGRPFFIREIEAPVP